MSDRITIERETLERAITALAYHQQQTRPIERTKFAIDELRAALAAQPAEAQQEPVAWRHSKTGRLYDSVEEVPLADGDEWAEPLYATPATQQAPAAWRQWSTKLHDWDYSTNRGDLRSDTAAEPLFLAPAQPADEIEHLRADLVSCRGTVKTELAHYERLAMVHGKTAVAANYEAEAQRLSDLLDRIDAMKDTP